MADYRLYMNRLLAILLLCLFSLPFSSRAENQETEAFAIAAKAYADGFFERAEKELGEFLARFPQSDLRSKAVLLQAQSRHQQRKYDAAIELLDASIANAGSLTPEYLYARAEALLEKGDFAAAAPAYGTVLEQASTSNLALPAAFNQALSFYRARDFSRTVELLESPEGAFQKLASPNLTNTLAIRGHLLLGEALLALNKTTEAKQALTPLSTISLPPEFDWERHDLLARAEFLSDQPANALPVLTNAANLALTAKNPVRLAQTYNLEADVFKKLSHLEGAVQAYDKIVAGAQIPAEQKRLALLKAVEIFSAQNRITNAISRLEQYLSQNAQDPSRDLLRIKTAELWLEQFDALVTRPVNQLSPGATNAISQARSHLNLVITQMTNSPHLGKAYLNLGWSFWNEGEILNDPALIQASLAAFQNASERLARSDDQALAQFKIGDVFVFQKRFGDAISNYVSVLRTYADLPQVRSKLFERTYQQVVRASIEQQDFARAESFISEMRMAFPRSTLTEQTLFLFGQALAQNGKTEEARKVFTDFETSFPQSSLIPSVQLAQARTYAAEAQWQEAINRFNDWLSANTNHNLRAQASFQRAWLNDQAGNKTNALVLFTNFVAQFPQHPLAPAAQNWVADYFYDQERWDLAELNYQRIFQNTNWFTTEVAYQARLMAARTAFFRQGYNDARNYLTNLLSDPTCPNDLRPEAWFTLGDVVIEQRITGSTNQLQNYLEAAKIYDLITTQYPTNKLTVLAWGKKGDCHLQLAVQFPDSFEKAREAYQRVLTWNATEVPVAALNQAEFGLAMLLERLAEARPSAERDALLKQALDHYLNIVHGRNLNNRRPDVFYLKKAGLAAGRLAESLGEKTAALNLYERLRAELPALRNVWEARIQLLRADLQRSL